LISSKLEWLRKNLSIRPLILYVTLTFIVDADRVKPSFIILVLLMVSGCATCHPNVVVPKDPMSKTTEQLLEQSQYGFVCEFIF
jgi:hypothetical protein